MFYQKTLTGAKPYFIYLHHHNNYSSHRHLEIELNYCIKGSFDIEINNHTYTVLEGQFAIIGSQISHSYPPADDILMLTLEVGPAFLNEHFRFFLNKNFAPVYDLNPTEHESYEIKEIRRLLFETADAYQNPTAVSELIITGNMRKIFAYILKEYILDTQNLQTQTFDQQTMIAAEKALNLIYNYYSENITVDDAAALAGYCKSGFCRMFKKVTGYTFHRFLTEYRIENACYYLANSQYSLGEIASMVGFTDSQVLCRVFKAHTGITPGEYRKEATQNQ